MNRLEQIEARLERGSHGDGWQEWDEWSEADVEVLLAVARAAEKQLGTTGLCSMCNGYEDDHGRSCPLAALLEEVPE